MSELTARPAAPAPSLLVLAASLLLAIGGAVRAQEDALEYAREPPAKIVGAQRCGECHLSALKVWRETAHATGFEELHRKEQAQAIAQRMGFRLLKRDSLCLRCHYTPEIDGGELRAVSGVSCESCHGAARDWIDIHNDYGGKDLDFRRETAEHRARRIAGARAAGMRRPSDLYELASTCYDCHLVPNERLVNVGQHSTGSGNFELMAWTQGAIRHNFLDSFLTGDGTQNAERPIERKRILYVAGRALELEHALRGVAQASGEGVFLKAMVRRVRNAVAELREIAARVELPELDRMLTAVREVRVGLGAGPALEAAARDVGEATRTLLGRLDGAQIAAVDPLMLGLEVPAVAEAGETPQGAQTGGAEEGAQGTQVAEGPATAAGEAGGGAAPRTAGAQAASSGAPGIPGQIKSRLRPAAQHDTVGPGACSSCHAPQNQWWFEDVHYTSAEPFFDQEPKNVQIARLYGIRPADMTRGNHLCMDCHGTVVSGKERREVLDGVSCESCHGPARDWLEVHKEGEGLGRARPAFKRSLELGKRDLRQLDQRARACLDCHYVTEPRLLSAGHPSGADFDYLGGLARTRHWERPLEAAAELRASLEAVIDERGAIPEVRLATLRAAAAAPAAAGGGAAASASAVGRAATTGGSPAGTSAQPARRLVFAGEPAGAAQEPVRVEGGELPPWPELDETTTVEELLLLVKERLERLYGLVGEATGGR